MNDSNVWEVEEWFVDKGWRLFMAFPELHLHVRDPDDRIRGKINIQLNGPLAGASISFWNKGDVQALVLDKVNRKEFALDDRMLMVGEDISSLLQSYSEKLASLLNELGAK